MRAALADVSPLVLAAIYNQSSSLKALYFCQALVRRSHKCAHVFSHIIYQLQHDLCPMSLGCSWMLSHKGPRCMVGLLHHVHSFSGLISRHGITPPYVAAYQGILCRCSSLCLHCKSCVPCHLAKQPGRFGSALLMPASSGRYSLLLLPFQLFLGLPCLFLDLCKCLLCSVVWLFFCGSLAM